MGKNIKINYKLDILLYKMDTDRIIFILTFFILIIFSVIGGLDLLETNWFDIGPSNSLTFFNAKIDTVGKYVFVVVFLGIIYTMNAIGEFYIDSWYTSHVHGIKYQKYDVEYLFRMTTCWRIYKMTMFLIQIHIAMSQLDLWIIALAFDCVIYTILTYREECKPNVSLTENEIKRLKQLLQRNN